MVQEIKITIHIRFIIVYSIVYVLKNIKNRFHDIIHIFKIILLQYFQFLIFNFSNNKLNLNGSLIITLKLNTISIYDRWLP